MLFYTISFTIKKNDLKRKHFYRNTDYNVACQYTFRASSWKFHVYTYYLIKYYLEIYKTDLFFFNSIDFK